MRQLKWDAVVRSIGLILKNSTLDIWVWFDLFCAWRYAFEGWGFLFLRTVIVSMVRKENFHIVSTCFFIYGIWSFEDLLLLSRRDHNGVRLAELVAEAGRNATCREHYVPLHSWHFAILVLSVWGLNLGISHSWFLVGFLTKHVIFA